ncbi:low molecular weight phosphotyrosine protein phosphatase [Methylomonas paludis]|uniref:protein-tyrosine-phosphatase n=2 Tax=Methylomonas paludis TaxID=1173101 RepID=A0A975MRA0_9GAMM|nr:low molecular weight phosphotyrosine protein phosphatase [Methylomonas paludis]
MGNICRSPTAEGVFTALAAEQKLLDHFKIDSAGTHAYHVGDAPDLRSQKAARDRGVELKHLRARKFIHNDFHEFDHILVMDTDNYQIVNQACPAEHKHKIRYFLDYAPHLNIREVPDPYYGGGNGFERVLDLVEAASVGLITSLKQNGELP